MLYEEGEWLAGRMEGLFSRHIRLSEELDCHGPNLAAMAAFLA